MIHPESEPCVGKDCGLYVLNQIIWQAPNSQYKCLKCNGNYHNNLMARLPETLLITGKILSYKLLQLLCRI